MTTPGRALYDRLVVYRRERAVREGTRPWDSPPWGDLPLPEREEAEALADAVLLAPPDDPRSPGQVLSDCLSARRGAAGRTEKPWGDLPPREREEAETLADAVLRAFRPRPAPLFGGAPFRASAESPAGAHRS